MSLSLSLSLSFFCHVKSPHHSDQISQRSQLSGIALWRCSLNAFVFVIVFVFVFVIVFLLVRSCLLITLITYLKGHKFLEELYGSVDSEFNVSLWVCDKVTDGSVFGLGQLKIVCQHTFLKPKYTLKLTRECRLSKLNWPNIECFKLRAASAIFTAS